MDAKTETSAIEAAFDRFTTERKDIAILLINQHVRVTWLGHGAPSWTSDAGVVLGHGAKDTTDRC